MTQYERKVARVSQYLTDVLRESFPEKAKNFEIVSGEVTHYINRAISSEPTPVPLSMQPTYEFYIRSMTNPSQERRVMILHRQDLAARVKGGIPNEKEYFRINSFRDYIEEQISLLEGQISKPL